MELNRRSVPVLRPALAAAWRRRPRGMFGWALYTVVVFVGGALVHRSGIVQRSAVWVVEEARTLPRVARGAMNRPRRLVIDIKYRHFAQIAAKREEALARGILVAGQEDFVPATIRFGDTAVTVELRLKGDLRDHWAGDKWSFRVSVDGENTVFGMKQFSLQHPATRNYLNEWLYHRALGRDSLIALRYDFVDVTVNGDEWGLYALEEHFDKRLVENNRRREGPIVRFSESLSWAEMLRHEDFGLQFADRRAGSGSYLASEVDGFQTARWLRDEAGRDLYLAAVDALEGYRRGDLTVDQAFDVELLARYFAITELLGALHAGDWRNARFYFNPITARLEPIGFDGDAGRRVQTLALARPGDIARSNPQIFHYAYAFWERLFEHAAFRRAYLAELERVTTTDYVDALLSDVDEDLDRVLTQLRREFPHLEKPGGVVRENAQYLRRVLHPVKAVQAYVADLAEGTMELEIGNLQMLPVEILGVAVGDSMIDRLAAAIELAGRPDSALVRYDVMRFPVPAEWTAIDSLVARAPTIQYRMAGTTTVRADTIVPQPRPGVAAGVTHLPRRAPNPGRFDFLDVDERRRLVTVRPGAWRITEDVVLPAGYTVHVSAGTRLVLEGGANVVSYSPMRMAGTEVEPIVVESRDSTGGGLVVLEADGPSVVEWVVFRNLAAPRDGGWELTGAVTFYESPVDIRHTVFEANRAEDGLNVIGGVFRLEQCHFVRAASDAVDIDFGRGEVIGSRFVDSFNDAVDLSGSVVTIRDLTVRGAGDKAVSAGEHSTVRIETARVTGATIGIASKDLSVVHARDVTVSASQIGMAAYQKKAEFGGGRITAEILQLVGVARRALTDPASRIEIDGQVQGPSQPRVALLVEDLVAQGRR